MYFDGLIILLCWSWQREVKHLLHQAFGFDAAQWPQTLEDLVGLTECRQENRHSTVTQDPRNRPDRLRSALSMGENEAQHNRWQGVHVVDVRELVQTLMETKYEYIMEVTDLLGVPLDKGWCAGNESR
jgi:hypothetical protein